jgi:hypothetical protein
MMEIPVISLQPAEVECMGLHILETEAAKENFTSSGFESTTIDEIAEKAGVPVPTV